MSPACTALASRSVSGGRFCNFAGAASWPTIRLYPEYPLLLQLVTAYVIGEAPGRLAGRGRYGSRERVRALL